jgi:hypothetical protein
MARTMLLHSKLPTKYYGEAHKTAVYIYNRLLHGNATSTPYELVYRQKPKIDHIRRFGSICYAYVPVEQRDKLRGVQMKKWEKSGVKLQLQHNH